MRTIFGISIHLRGDEQIVPSVRGAIEIGSSVTMFVPLDYTGKAQLLELRAAIDAVLARDFTGAATEEKFIEV